MNPKLYSIIPIILVLTGCMSEKTIVMKYYVLDNPAEQYTHGFDSGRVIKGVCEVEETEINPVLETNQIINRSNSHEITYYKYHQWAIRPSIAVMEIVQNHLESSGVFENVYSRHRRSIPDYRFVTSLHRLEVIENNESFSAHVKLEYSIIDNTNDQVLLIHQTDRTSALTAKDLNLFVREVSNIIYQELNAFIAKIEENRSIFTRDPAGQPAI